MAVLYIASDRKGAGKTALCATLAQRLLQEGRRVALFKPLLEAPPPQDQDGDTQLFQWLLKQESGDWPIPVSSQGLEEAGLRDRVMQAFQQVSQEKDVVLVEGLSGLDNQASAEMAQALDAQVLVVAGFRPDLRAEELSGARGLFGDRLVGVIINGLTRYMGARTRRTLVPCLDSQGLRVLGVIPEERRLLGVSVRRLNQHLQGRFLLREEKGDRLVEHLLIGGLILDWGVNYFGRFENKAVIVRGDRPDIQMSALETSTSCLVLTNGHEPIEYVRYEAQEEEVPVILVESDSLSTATALETLMEKAAFDHPLKLERFQELLTRHADLDAIYASLGLAR